MANVKLNTGRVLGNIKPMHCVNNGPIIGRSDQTRRNFELYKAARIPYARNHDASAFLPYGGEHTVDVHAVFPNFDADPNDPASYDFPCTDKYTAEILSAGTRVFYRLGSKIEHEIKKYGTVMPRDFHKWAVICEHIIAHYNEGWANGFHYNIEYWEIWNEPDLDGDDSTNKRCWGGTANDFYEFYSVAATHLKNRFPSVKIGGPAMAHRTGEWLDEFLARLTRDGERVPLDFFSWHIYADTPEHLVRRADIVRKKLDAAGYTHTESILNEWNYVKDWSERFIYSIETIIGMKGAAFTAACMSVCQSSSVDMLMYYDARPTVFNGLFDYYTYRPLKGYYPFTMFADLYDLGTQVAADSDDRDIYVTAAANSNKAAAMITYYTDDDAAEAKLVTLSADCGDMQIKLLDTDNTMTVLDDKVKAGREYTVTLKPQSVLFLETV